MLTNCTQIVLEILVTKIKGNKTSKSEQKEWPHLFVDYIISYIEKTKAGAGKMAGWMGEGPTRKVWRPKFRPWSPTERWEMEQPCHRTLSANQSSQ